MIRLATPHDMQAVIDVTVASGLFRPEDAEFLHAMMTDYFNSKAAEGHICLIDDETEPLAVAYYDPVPATDGTWSLTLIAVRRDRQGRGRGAALMRHMEDDLREKGQRLVLVQTSGLPGFAQTRNFYLKCGYEQEARVRDYYTTGEDMILFRKDLNITG